MKAPRYKPSRKFGFNMTPMIDVVFLLIIFFLVSSHLAQRENRIEVDLPMAASGEDDTPSSSPRVTVTVLADGTVLLAGKPIALVDLSARLKSRRLQSGDQVELRIRSDRRALYQIIEPVLSSAAEAGVWNVTFAVLERAR